MIDVTYVAPMNFANGFVEITKWAIFILLRTLPIVGESKCLSHLCSGSDAGLSAGNATRFYVRYVYT